MIRRRRGAGRSLLSAIAVAAVAMLLLTAAPVAALRWVPPPTTAFMLIRRFGPRAAGTLCQRPAYEWVPWAAISPHVPIAIVAAEDQRFPAHRGFDLDAIADALQTAGREDGRRLRGASTISQQVAKNLFLWPGRSWVRKGLEAYFTVLIETLWPKRRILEMYMNVVQLGDCTFGVGAASRQFFRQPPSALGPEHAAVLAAVLPNPSRFRADRPSSHVRRRALWIIDQVHRLGGRAYLGAL